MACMTSVNTHHTRVLRRRVVLSAAALFILPESPRWLVVNGHLDLALAVIHRVFTKSTLPTGAILASS